MPRSVRSSAAVLLVLLVPAASLSQEASWANPAGGLFDAPTNWTSNALPRTNGTAIFAIADSAYTVTFTSSRTNRAWVVEDGAVTFDLSGLSHALTDDFVLTLDTFAQTPNTASTFTARNGSVSARNITLTRGESNNVTTMAIDTGAVWAVRNNVSVGPGTRFTVVNGGAAQVANHVNVGPTTGTTAATLAVNGGGSLLTAAGLYVGGTSAAAGGPAAAAVGPGAAVVVSGETRVYAGSALTLDGGTLATGSLARAGTLAFNDGTLAVAGAFENGPAAAPLVIDGNLPTARPTLALSNPAAVTNVTGVTVGNARRGALTLSGGRALDAAANNVSIGATGTGDGTVSLAGAGTTLSTAAALAVGGSGATAGGTGRLTVGPGATAAAGTLHLHALGTVELAGGTLRVGSLGATDGAVQFAAGRFEFAADATAGAAALSADLGPTRQRQAGRTVAAGGALTLAAGLTVSGGTLSAGTTLTTAAGATLAVAGPGEVAAAAGIVNDGTLRLENNAVPTAGGTLTNNGTIRGSGLVGNPLANGTAGSVQLTAGNRIEFTGTGHTNAGLVSLVGGEVQFNGPLTNAAGTGLIAARDAVLRFNGGLTNAGGLAVSNGTVDVTGDVAQQVGGRVTVSGGGTANFADDVTLAPGAAGIQVSAVGGTVSKVVLFGAYNGGTTGGGQAFLEGDHRPGHSPGLVRFDGDVFYGGGSNLVIELAGPARGTGHDAVDAAGAVGLAGRLTVDLLDGYAPGVGQTFLVLGKESAGPASGTFAGLPEGAVFGADGVAFRITYAGGTGNDVALTVVPVPEPALAGGLAAAGLLIARRVRRQAA